MISRLGFLPGFLLISVFALGACKSSTEFESSGSTKKNPTASDASKDAKSNEKPSADQRVSSDTRTQTDTDANDVPTDTSQATDLETSSLPEGLRQQCNKCAQDLRGSVRTAGAVPVPVCLQSNPAVNHLFGGRQACTLYFRIEGGSNGEATGFACPCDCKGQAIDGIKLPDQIVPEGQGMGIGGPCYLGSL